MQKRKFGGKTYSEAEVYNNRGGALTMAEKYRAQGYNARVIKSTREEPQLVKRGKHKVWSRHPKKTHSYSVFVCKKK